MSGSRTLSSLMSYLPRLREIQLENDVHFTFEGSRVLAGRVAEAILQVLDQRRRGRP